MIHKIEGYVNEEAFDKHGAVSHRNCITVFQTNWKGDKPAPLLIGSEGKVPRVFTEEDFNKVLRDLKTSFSDDALFDHILKRHNITLP
jgi:hypothetical protein